VIAGRLCLVPLSSGFSFVCAFFLLVSPVHAEQTDEFIGTIEKIKTSIAPVTCAHAGAPSKFDVRVQGTAFFIDTHGAFVTAGHVLKSIVEKKDSCETPAVLVLVHGTASETFDLYGLKFVASDCRVDDTVDAARCKTIADPTTDKKIVTKPTALTIATDIQPDGTPVAFTGFPINGLTPYTARANIAGYQFIDSGTKQDLQLQMIVLDKQAWPGSSGGPVYGIDGRVMGMLLQAGNGLAFARHGARLSEFVNSP